MGEFSCPRPEQYLKYHKEQKHHRIQLRKGTLLNIKYTRKRPVLLLPTSNKTMRVDFSFFLASYK